MTRLLGAVLAGGASRRFGSDKALHVLDGKPLIGHVIDRLRPQVEALVVVGRDWPGEVSIDDRPAAGLGPLGGLCGALAHAAAAGFDVVVTSGCDLPDLPLDLAQSLGIGPAVAAGQPLLGVWPAALAGRLEAHLAETTDRSMRAWVAVSGSRPVDLGTFRNINTPADLPVD